MTSVTPTTSQPEKPLALDPIEGQVESSFLDALKHVLGSSSRSASRAHEAAISADRHLLREGSASPEAEPEADPPEVVEAPAPRAPDELRNVSKAGALRPERPAAAATVATPQPAASRDVAVSKHAAAGREAPAVEVPAVRDLFSSSGPMPVAAHPVVPSTPPRTSVTARLAAIPAVGATVRAGASRSPAKAPPPSPTPNFEGAARTIQESLEASIRVRGGDERWVVQVHLDPPELGNVRIHLEMRGSHLSGTLEVEDPEVGEALEDLLGELEQGLREGGQEAQLRLTSRATKEGAPQGVDTSFEEEPVNPQDPPSSDHLLDLLA